jgi:hypothetical protein
MILSDERSERLLNEVLLSDPWEGSHALKASTRKLLRVLMIAASLGVQERIPMTFKLVKEAQGCKARSSSPNAVSGDSHSLHPLAYGYSRLQSCCTPINAEVLQLGSAS